MSSDFKENILAGKENAEVEACFKAVYGHCPIGIVMNTAKGTLLGNRVVCQMLGYTQAELLQLSIIEITHPDDQFIDQKQYKQFINGKIDTFSSEKRFVKKNGSFIWCQITLTDVKNKQGKTEAQIAYLQDIHEKRITNIAFDNISENLSTQSGQDFFNSLVTGIAKNLNVPYVFVGNYNPLKNEITTASFWAKDKFIEFNYILEGTPCNDVIKNKKELCIIKEVQKIYPTDVDLIELNIEGYYGSPLLNIEGETFGHIAIMDEKPLKDLNLIKSIIKIYSTRAGAELERYQNELVLKKSEAKYRSISDNNLLGIAVADASFKFTEVNPAFCQMLGYTKEELLQKTIGDISDGKDKEKSLKMSESIINREYESFSFQKSYIKKDGSKIFAHTSARGTYDNAGNFTGCIATIQNITERIKAEKSLEQKNAQLKKYIDSNMQLENFAYIASHDMKQPLRTIGNFTGLLQNRLKDKLDKDTSDYMTFILEAVKEMSQLIEDLLLYSRVNQEHKNEEINLELLLEQVTKIIDQDIKNHQAKIEFSNIPAKITGNQTKLKQLFQNLIINAIKFKKPSETPRVKIKVKNKKAYWLFSVEDNGIGISEEFHENVFLLFKKLHSKSEYEGTGIGLALCKKIVEQHGGEIWIDSTLNKGTVFHFTISKNL